ncbi:MAG: leucine-rich repeat domain-containing protein [Clostridiales bacterium]|nr:leucine-rich repeat domain-containing protein [Clostridiales bacterium]
MAKTNGGFNSGKIKFWRPVSGQKRRDWRKLPPEERKKLEGIPFKERVRAFFRRADRTKLVAVLSSVLVMLIVGGIVLSIALGGGGGDTGKDKEKDEEGKGSQTEEFDRFFEFTLKDNAYELSSVKPGYVSYIIPEEYDYKPVKSIAENAFANKDFVEILSVPGGVKEMPKGVLKDLTRLKELTLPFIGANAENADANAENFDKARFCYIFGDDNSKIPDTLTKLTVNGNITKNAFKDAGGGAQNRIETIKIGGKIKTVHEYALFGCPSLKEVTVGENIETIKEYAFSGCPSLVKITVESAKLTSAAPSAFDENLTSLTFSAYSKEDAEKADWYKTLVGQRPELNDGIIKFKPSVNLADDS